MHPLHEPHSFEVASDVTLQQNDVKTGTSSVAISTKTNVQWNGRRRQQKQRRIYTSTPKNEFNKQRKSQQSNDAIELCRLAKATAKRFIVGAANSVKGQESTFNARLKTLILLFGILIIGYKIIILTMPYINASSVQQLSNYVQTQLSVAFGWSEENQLRGKLIAVLFGLFVTVFGCVIVYFDSAVPGVLPPSPFSKQQRSPQKTSSMHLNYLCALVAGVTFTYFMYSD